MGILAILVNEPFWQDVMEDMLAKGTKTTHILAQMPPDRACVTYALNHNITMIDRMVFYKLDDVAPLTATCRAVLDKKTLDYFEEIERDYYILTDRYNYLPRAFRYKKRLFRETLRYALEYLRRENITMIMSSCTPHDLPNFVFYHAAKYLNIPTLHFGHTMINDYVLPATDYRYSDKVPEDFLAGESAEEIVAKISPVLMERVQAESNFIIFSKFLNKQAIDKDKKYRIKDSGAKMTRHVDAIKDGEVQKGLESLGLVDFKKRRNLLFMDDMVNKYRRKFIKKYEACRIHKLHDEYLSLCQPADLKANYVYYSMHMQPERTATPEAEMFEDQLLAITILSASLPPGWKVYVKEHPSQFHVKMSMLRSAHKRDKSDYEDIVRLKNAILIRDDVPSADLVDNSKIVATLSGSVGWECLKKGRACLVFAHAWYAACQSIAKIENVEQCRAALAKLCAKTPEEVSMDLLKYLVFMQDKFIIGNLGEESSVETMTLPYDEHVNSMSDYICEFATSHK